ncbi:hypothetical protein F5148DRAFT_563093 [Russula earlei]|uniref:Uncharacterized protein n=1 Tax=Russula earlei TaxID=71964 RepID=A0ACC0UPG3_9AGAM|nr:hypothetical protein F5148DRAFT_563093 [Russula earlei]
MHRMPTPFSSRWNENQRFVFLLHRIMSLILNFFAFSLVLAYTYDTGLPPLTIRVVFLCAEPKPARPLLLCVYAIEKGKMLARTRVSVPHSIEGLALYIVVTTILLQWISPGDMVFHATAREAHTYVQVQAGMDCLVMDNLGLTFAYWWIAWWWIPGADQVYQFGSTFIITTFTLERANLAVVLTTAAIQTSAVIGDCSAEVRMQCP